MPDRVQRRKDLNGKVLKDTSVGHDADAASSDVRSASRHSGPFTTKRQRTGPTLVEWTPDLAGPVPHERMSP
jgi:hypothetical protein